VLTTQLVEWKEWKKERRRKRKETGNADIYEVQVFFTIAAYAGRSERLLGLKTLHKLHAVMTYFVCEFCKVFLLNFNIYNL
jgi:hypothetical protein